MDNQTNNLTKQYLVVTQCDGDQRVVEELIRTRLKAGPAQFVVLVPATPPHTRSLTWTEEQARRLAHRRLEAALDALRGLGANVSGVIGADSITDAIGDTLRTGRFDEVILATPPQSIIEKLWGGFTAQVKQMKNIPVTRVLVPTA